MDLSTLPGLFKQAFNKTSTDDEFVLLRFIFANLESTRESLELLLYGTREAIARKAAAITAAQNVYVKTLIQASGSLGDDEPLSSRLDEDDAER